MLIRSDIVMEIPRSLANDFREQTVDLIQDNNETPELEYIIRALPELCAGYWAHHLASQALTATGCSIETDSGCVAEVLPFSHNGDIIQIHAVLDIRMTHDAQIEVAALLPAKDRAGLEPCKWPALIARNAIAGGLRSHGFTVSGWTAEVIGADADDPVPPAAPAAAPASELPPLITTGGSSENRLHASFANAGDKEQWVLEQAKQSLPGDGLPVILTKEQVSRLCGVLAMLARGTCTFELAAAANMLLFHSGQATMHGLNTGAGDDHARDAEKAWETVRDTPAPLIGSAREIELRRATIERLRKLPAAPHGLNANL